MSRCVVCNGPANKQYCSSECFQLRRWEKQRARLLAIGRDDAPNHKGAKRLLLETPGRKCAVCGTEEWCGKPVPLVLDHINGDPYDNSLANFRLICGNCDMQSEFYKNKNRGRGRFSRRERYSQGKSY